MGDLELEFTKQELDRVKAERDTLQYKYHGALSDYQRLQSVLVQLITEALNVPNVVDVIVDITNNHFRDSGHYEAIADMMKSKMQRIVNEVIMEHDMKNQPLR